MTALAVKNGADQIVYIDVVSGSGTQADPYVIRHEITGTPNVRQAHLDPAIDAISLDHWAGVPVVEADGRPEMIAALYNPVNQQYYRPLANYLYTAIPNGTRTAPDPNSAAVGTVWQYNPSKTACLVTFRLKTAPGSGTLQVRLLRGLLPDGTDWDVAASAAAVSTVNTYRYLFAENAKAISGVTPIEARLPAYWRPEVVHSLATGAWEYELIMEVLD
jgi:hypothetical protein